MKKWLSFIAVLAIVGVMAGSILPALPVGATSVEKDYQKSSTWAEYGDSSTALGQQFTASSSYSFTHAIIEVAYSSSRPTSITLSLYNADGSGYPTGTALGSATIAGAQLLDYDTASLTLMKTSFFFAATITASQVYDLVLTTTGGGTARWRIDEGDVYGGGQAIKNTGGGWAAESAAPSYDYYFDTFTGSDPPTIDDVQGSYATEHTTTSVNVNFFAGTLAYSNATYHIEYGTSTGSYTSNSTTQNYTYAGINNPELQAPITGLSASTIYYYKAVLTTSGGTATSANEYTFTTSAATSNNSIVYEDVGSSYITTSLSYNIQDKTWYALGRYWAFLSDPSSNDISFTSSPDGSTWSDLTAITSLGYYGGQYSVWWDGTYFHMAYCEDTLQSTGSSGALFYRRGTPHLNGTVTWDTEQTVVAQPANDGTAWFKPVICTDSNGYPVIAYGWCNAGVAPVDQDTIVLRSSTKNGTWTTDGAFTTDVGGANSSYVRPDIVPLTNGKIYVTVQTSGGTSVSRGELYNGSTWGSLEAISTEEIPDQYIPSVLAIGNGDTVYYTFRTTDNKIKMVIRTYGSGWGSELTVSDTAYDTTTPELVSPLNDTGVYIFWAGSPNPYTVYYRYYNSGSFGTTTQFAYETNPTYTTTSHYTDFPALMTVIPNPPQGVLGCLWTSYSDSSLSSTGAAQTIINYGQITTGLPTATTNDATNITTSSVTLNGQVISMGVYTPLYVSFQYGTSTAYGTTTTEQMLTSAIPFSVNLSALPNGTTYHFQAIVRYGTSLYVLGTDKTFTTGGTSTSTTTTSTTTTTTTTAPTSTTTNPGGPISGSFPFLRSIGVMAPILILLFFTFMPLVITVKKIKEDGISTRSIQILAIYAICIIVFLALFPQIVHLVYHIITM